MTRTRLPPSILLLGLTLTTCAPALRPPPSVADLAGVDPGAADLEAARELADRAEARFAERPEPEAVREAERLWLRAAVADPEAVEPLIGTVRAKIWLANHLEDGDARDRAARTAVQAAQWCEVRAPRLPDCHYWLALAVGVQSRELTSTARSGLDEMVERLRLVAEAKPDLEHAGPHRVLARVLVNAPGWPTGPGDPDRGLDHARQAVERFPDYPPNVLALAEALRELGRRAEAREAYRRAAELARERVEAGDPDAPGWVRDARSALADLQQVPGR